MAEQDIDPTLAPRRRNGRPQACEPCRKRKIACDHTQPVCHRCRARKVASSCIYLESPMAVLRTQSESAPPDSTTPVPVVNVTRHQALHYRRDSGRITKASTRTAPLFSGPAAFLGPTSFSSVFLENRSRLEPTSDLEPTTLLSNEGSPSMLESRGSAAEDVDVSDELVQLGVGVLKRIPDETTTLALFAKHVNPHDGWSRMAADGLLRSFWATFGKVLSKRNPAELTRMSKQICQNGMTDIADEDDYTKWLGAFSGENMRWEAIGVLFTYWTFGVAGLSEQDPILLAQTGHRRDRKQFMLEMKECALSCMALCSHRDCINTLVIYLIYKHMLLESIISGDASQILWRQHGDLVAVVTSVGLHRETDTGPVRVSINSELKRRVFSAVFNIDKVISTYTGRPPILSHRYCFTPLPLDLRDEDLMADEATRARAIAELDSDGWNTKGEILSTTVLRARTMFAYIRDEVLEMALGPVAGDVAVRAVALKDRSLLTYERLPSFIRFSPQDLSDTSLPGPVIYARSITRLEHLHNMFLLERLIVKHAHVSGQELLDTAREMLELVIHFWMQRERFAGIRSDFQWMIMYYAAPACGTLCVELLKQTKNRTEESLWLPRSSVIQNLSMLMAFLDWAKSNAPNEDLCSRVRNIISRVLDQALDPPDNSADIFPENMGELPFDFPTFEELGGRNYLLDTFDWMTG